MILRRYQPEDYETIVSWLTSWNLNPPTRGMLPKIGFMVDKIAVCFLEQPDTDSCYLENMYSNPFASKDVRDIAINKIIDEAFIVARNLGFKRMLSTTDHPAIIKRAYQRGSTVEINKVLIISHL